MPARSSPCEFHITRMQTKFYPIRPHHMEGWAGLSES